MVRIQLHLTEAQDRALRAMAKRRAVTRAELIRHGIELALREDRAPVEDPLASLVGQAGPGPTTDGAERHDDVLYARVDEDASHLLAAEPRPKHRRK